MKFDTKDIKSRARKDFEKTWLETASLLPAEKKRDYRGGKGKPHPMHEIIGQVRDILLNLGFDEVENAIFIPEEEIYWQYGPEAPVILDRCYYLAGLPRPDIGLGKEKLREIREINPSIETEKLQSILRAYREGSIEGDDLFEEMVKRLGIETGDAARIVDAFPEFRGLQPVAEKTTLRSHMTGVWFPTLKALQKKAQMPIKAFSIGMRFRREQKIDATHLRAHYGASCVIMDPEISLASGKEVVEEVFKALKFKDLRYETKKATSNYYAPRSELEIFSGDIEVGDCGMYSPVALANYGIEYPVFNIGFGLERILMIRNNISDIRELLYPQFYSGIDLSDEDIINSISIIASPVTPEGMALSESIRKTARENADRESPCRFTAYEGILSGKTVEVEVIEPEENTKLLGPAALNRIYVFDGGIHGIPKNTEGLKEGVKKIAENGVDTGLDYLKSISDYFAASIEKSVSDGERSGIFSVKIAKNPSDINISVSDIARRYITSRKKPIALKGPVFMSVEYTVRE